jgi:IS30 family transposase
MANNKHLTLDNRIDIEAMLKHKTTFNQIGKVLDKDSSTISKEIRSRLLFMRTGGKYTNYNACAFRSSCTIKHLCSPCNARRNYKLCRNCSMCNAFCKDFQEQKCSKLSKPPYVCNSCNLRFSCTLEKKFYYAKEAHTEYKEILSETRTGISLSEDEIRYIDELISPLVMRNHSPHNIYVANKDTIMIGERTIYRLIDAGLIAAKNIDLPRKVRFRARKKSRPMKVDKTCRIGRDWEHFRSYLTEYPDIPITQLDTLEGKKGGSVLLTIHFIKAEFMLAFLRERNDSKSVTDIFENLYRLLKPERFKILFKLCLADNGSEFSNPNAIEFDELGEFRTSLFYCNPNAPYQKGSLERNHQFIRYFIPKGTDISIYTQEDISLMMNHINSYARESLNDNCPYDMFKFLYGSETLKLLGCHKIPPNDVTLKKSIFRKEASHDAR